MSEEINLRSDFDTITAMVNQSATLAEYTITVTDITGGHRVTITKDSVSQIIDLYNGADGEDGEDGADGFSPVVTVVSITGGHRVTITDATGAHSFDVMDGQAGDIIDDTSTTLTKVWSSSKVNTELSGKAAASHTHDDRYYTESETDALLSEKSDTGHTHDGRYYTESETDTLLSGKAAASHTHAQSDVTGLAAALSDKQDKLIAGTNITIAADGRTISASGGSSIEGAVRYDTAQSLTSAQKVQSRANIGFADAKTTTIIDMTVSEQGVSEIIFTNADFGGKDYVFIYVDILTVPDAQITKQGQLVIGASKELTNPVGRSLLWRNGNGINTNAIKSRYMIASFGANPIVFHLNHSQTSNESYANWHDMMREQVVNYEQFDYIRSIWIYSPSGNEIIPTGTTIRIFGIERG